MISEISYLLIYDKINYISNPVVAQQKKTISPCSYKRKGYFKSNKLYINNSYYIPQNE